MRVSTVTFVLSKLGCAILICLGSAGTVRAQDRQSFPTATPESQGVPSAAVRRLADEVDGYVKSGKIVGAELLVIKNRKTILHEAFGLRDREEKLPMVPDTIFNIRSMTKTLTGVAVQMLVDEGKIHLDDPVAKYLPGFDNDKSRAITVRQLLEHRSGLPLTILASINAYKDLQTQANRAGEMGPQYKPGSRFNYSDAGSDAAAAIVEKVSGQTIDKFVTERILRPLGMNDSFYPSKADDPRKKRIASLYLGTPGKWTRFWKAGSTPMYTFAWGSQTLYSTPSDYARFLTLWLDGGKVGGQQILSKDAVTRILTPSSPMLMLGTDSPFPTGFAGLNVWYGEMSLLHEPGDSPKVGDAVVIGHSGSDGTAAWAFPAQDLIVCLFTQSRGSSATLRFESTIQDALVPGNAPAQAPADLQPYLGTFYANFGHYKNEPFQILYRNGGLALDIPDQLVFELKKPDKDGRWQFAVSDKVAVDFKKDESGKVVSMSLHQGGMTFVMKREKSAEPEPLSREAVAKYLGKYRRQEDKVVVEVLFKDGVLAVKVPGVNMEVEFVQRSEKMTWESRTQPGLKIVFHPDSAGKIASFTAELPDGKRLLRERVTE